jgi:uncharacterized protein (TIGR02145 family)
MKKGTKLFIYSFIVLGFVMVLTNSCKKEDTKMDPVITWVNPADISFGTLLSVTQLNATADLPGTFIYTPPAGTKLNVGANQDLKVDFTPTDATTYNTASKMVIINVTAPITVTDIDGNLYNTVTIGTQTWMVENLKTTKYCNGDPIPNITDASEWGNLSIGTCCDYDNTLSNCSIYGKLYNWYAVDDSRNIAPTGWHVPSEEEWTTLKNYMTANLGASSSVAKALASNIYWARYAVNGGSTPDPGAVSNDLTKNNGTGFTALPGGYINYYGQFYEINRGGYWWSSTAYNADTAYCQLMSWDGNIISSNNESKVDGFSVRLVRD